MTLSDVINSNTKAIHRDLSILADGLEIAKGCHIHLTGSATSDGRMAHLFLQIEDLKETEAEILSFSNGVEVFLSGKPLATARPMDVITRVRDGRKQTLVILPGYAEWLDTTVFGAWPAGMKKMDIVKALLKQFCPTIHLSTEEDTGSITRGCSLFGKLRDELPPLLQTDETKTIYLPDSVRVNHWGELQDTLILFDHDLQKKPAFTRYETILCVWPKNLNAGDPCNLSGISTLDAVYAGWIAEIRYDMDNRGGPWQMELVITNAVRYEYEYDYDE